MIKMVPFAQLVRQNFIINFSCLLLHFSLSAQYFSANIYKDQEGMSSNRIIEMTQMKNKELWVATQDGISYYDGLVWKTFPDSLSFIPSTGLVKMQAMEDTSIYVLGASEVALTLARYQHGKWEEIALPERFEKLSVYSGFKIAGDPETGQLAIASGPHIYFQRGDRWEHVALPVPTHRNFHLTNLRFYGDSLLISSSMGLQSYRGGTFHALLRGSEVHDFLWCEEKSCWLLLGEDWLGELKEPHRLEKYFDRVKVGLGGLGGFSNLLYQNGKIYYSVSSPLYRYDPDAHQRLPVITQEYDLDYTCNKALFDHEGNLWCGTLRGAFKINNLGVHNFNGNELLENEVTAICEAPNGDLYLGSNIGLNILRSDGEIEQYPFPKSILQPRIMDIVWFQEEIFMAANSAGVVRFADGTFHYDTIGGLGTRVIDIHIYNDRLYASSKGLLLEKKESGWETVKGVDQGDLGVIRKILMQDEQALLMTHSGILEVNGGKIFSSPKINENNIYTAFVYRDTVFLGTAAGPRALIDERIVTPRWAGLIDHPVYSYATDATGRLWVGTGQGIFPTSSKTHFHLDKSNGLAGNEINRSAFKLLQNGQLAIGTDQGVSFFTPDTRLALPVPSVEILPPRVNEREPGSWPGLLPYYQNNIKFDFRAISYFDEEKINYRVKLNGQEDSWHEILFHNQRSLLYSNLEPGSYQFIAQARIGNGEWGETVTSPMITIRPALYNRAVFRLLSAILLIILIFLVIRLRGRQLRARNDLLRQKIDEKTSELNQQNQELLKAIADLKSAQGQLIQSEKLASMGHLTAGIAHELNNPLNYIRGGAECIIKNLDELDELIARTGPLKNHAEVAKEYRYIMEDSKQLAQSILTGASKSTSIVKSLSSFTADAQNFFSFIDLEKEVETALTLLNNEIGFRITVNRLFGNLPPLECYPAKINQMIVNILLNAIQAIRDTGEITIRLYRKDVSFIGLEVTDNGEGLQVTDTEKVFEPFYTTKDTNPGLGLTIVKSIVQEHNGSIYLEALPRGTKVCVYLPVNQTSHPELED